MRFFFFFGSLIHIRMDLSRFLIALSLSFLSSFSWHFSPAVQFFLIRFVRFVVDGSFRRQTENRYANKNGNFDSTKRQRKNATKTKKVRSEYLFGIRLLNAVTSARWNMLDICFSLPFSVSRFYSPCDSSVISDFHTFWNFHKFYLDVIRRLK